MVNILETTGKDGNIVQYNQMELTSEEGRRVLAERLQLTRDEFAKKFNIPLCQHKPIA